MAEEVGGWGLGGVKTRRCASSGARSRVSAVTRVLSGRLSAAATQNLATMRVAGGGEGGRLGAGSVAAPRTCSGNV